MTATQQYAIWPDPRSRSQRSKSCENGRFQSLISSANMHVIKRQGPRVNYDKTTCISKFCPDRFFIFFLIRRHATFKVRLPSYEGQSSPAVPYDAYLLLTLISKFAYAKCFCTSDVPSGVSNNSYDIKALDRRHIPNKGQCQWQCQPSDWLRRLRVLHQASDSRLCVKQHCILPQHDISSASSVTQFWRCYFSLQVKVQAASFASFFSFSFFFRSSDFSFACKRINNSLQYIYASTTNGLYQKDVII